MTVLNRPQLWNWYCPECKEWRGIDAMNEAEQCRECKTKCVWIRYNVEVVKEDER